MKKLLMVMLITLLFVGVTIAGYETHNPDRLLVLNTLSDRNATQLSFEDDLGESGNGVNSAIANSAHFSEYYQLTSELLY